MEHDAQWSDDTRKARDSYWIRRPNTIQPHGIKRATRTKNGCVSACERLTSGRLRIVSEGWTGSRENTKKLYTIDVLTQVCHVTHRPADLLIGCFWT